jgi:hypothetical protein
MEEDLIEESPRDEGSYDEEFGNDVDSLELDFD